MAGTARNKRPAMKGAARERSRGGASSSGSRAQPKPARTRSASRVQGPGENGGSDRLYLIPDAILGGAAAGRAVRARQAAWLAGGPLAFGQVELIRRDERRRQARRFTLPGLRDWLGRQRAGLRQTVTGTMKRLAAARAPFAGLALDRPLIMGVINVTPDSFSDGGKFLDAEAAVRHGRALMEAGADILDIGGESTRPGAEPVSPDEEMRRVLPATKALAAAGAVISIDTRHARVMAAAVEAGAKIINDVTALTGDKESLGVAARSGAAIVLMHMQGEPRTMQASPRYREALLDLYDYFEGRLAAVEAAGIDRARVAVDPGIGFGKTVAHNRDILAHLALYHGLGCPILLGVSRKSFIARLSRGEDTVHRLAGSLAAGLWGFGQGAQILRVHDVAETAQARAVWQALAVEAE
ncbi:MAG: dihydropteroate synthase [Pseudomonadota bacterium]